MADLRIPAVGSSLVPQAGASPARSEAVRAAQRAFFQAALNGVEPVSGAPAAGGQPRVVPAAPAQGVRSDGSPPSRLLRPGSLLDIKV